MSDRLRAAANEALAALLRVQPQVRGAIPQQDVEDAIDALRAALAEPEAKYSDIVSDGGMDPRNQFDVVVKR